MESLSPVRSPDSRLSSKIQPRPSKSSWTLPRAPSQRALSRWQVEAAQLHSGSIDQVHLLASQGRGNMLAQECLVSEHSRPV